MAPSLGFEPTTWRLTANLAGQPTVWDTTVAGRFGAPRPGPPFFFGH